MDQFDINREMTGAAGKAVDAAMDLLETDKEKTRSRDGRLVLQDDGHYYDPQTGWVLAKEGSQYKRLHQRGPGQATPEAP